MENQKLDVFAVVELFGHSKMAGKVTEQTMGAATFIRVDVPEVNGIPAFTRMLNPSAIYAINPVSEEIMLAMAGSIQYAPIRPYDLPKSMRQELPAAVHDDEDQDDQDSDLTPGHKHW